MQDIPSKHSVILIRISYDLKRVDLDKFLISHSDAADVFFLLGRGAISQKNVDIKPS